MMTRRHLLLSFALACVAGCGNTAPRALVRGEDSCAYCRMTIDDVRFGVLVLTDRGRLQTFDAIECAASWLAAQDAAHAPRAIWVANFADPSQWVDATKAVYLQGSRLRSPMGRDLVAFAADADPDALQRAHGGTAITWLRVQEIVAMAAAPIASSPNTPESPDAHAH